MCRQSVNKRRKGLLFKSILYLSNVSKRPTLFKKRPKEDEHPNAKWTYAANYHIKKVCKRNIK